MKNRMSCVLIAAFAAALTVCVTMPAYAAGPLYVSPSGDDADDGTIDNPLKSITHAVSLLSAGEEVRVLPGTYSVAGTGETFPIQPGSVSIVGHDTAGPVDPANHVISGEDATVTLLKYNDGDSASLAGFTLGFTKDTPVVVQAGELTMTNCTVKNVTVNNSTYSGRATAVQVYTGGTLTATDCTFTDTTGRGVIEGAGPGVIDESSQAFVNAITLTGCTFTGNTSGNGALNATFAKAVITVTDCLFENNTSAASNQDTMPASVLHCRAMGAGSAFSLDRCRLIGNTGQHVINTDQSNHPTTVSNCLIAGNLPSQTVIGGNNQPTPKFINCTIVNNSTVRGGTGRNFPASANFDNCIISSNTLLNDSSNNIDGLILTNTILWATPLGEGYNEAGSDVIPENPQFRGETDFRLRSTSPAVDAGSNDLVQGSTDLVGGARILDGTVDLGAYERDPSVVEPAFNLSAYAIDLYAGAGETLDLSVASGTGEAVTANLAYDTGISGPASVEIADGTGPVQFTVTADSPVVDMSSATVTITDAAGNVLPTSSTVVLHKREVTIGHEPKFFVPTGEQTLIRVSLMSDTLGAPGDVAVTLGAPTGDGTNTAAWSGSNIIADGQWQTGDLVMTGGTGTNSFTLTMGNGFEFVESNDSVLTIEMVAYESPVYVSTTGSDTTGNGSLGNPVKSITHASTFVQTGDEIRLLPGTYTTDTGETFPIQPGSVSIVAYDPDGPVDPANHEISGEYQAVVLLEYSGGDSASLADLTLGSTNNTPIVVQAGELVMENCTVKNVTVDNSTYGGRATAVQVYTDGTLTATDCTFTNTNGRGVIEGGGPGVIDESSKAFVNDITLAGCTFTGNTSGNGALNVSFAKAAFTVTDCLFESNTSTTSASDTTPATVFHHRVSTAGCSLAMDRCRVVNNSGVGLMRFGNISPAVFSNCLFSGNTPSQCVFLMLPYWGGTPVITNCTIAGNATVVGGTSARATINNCIISDNEQLNGTATETDLLVLNNSILWATPLGEGYGEAGSTNVIQQDPMLLLDYAPRPDSPAIDAGSNDLVVGELDLNGNPRIVNGNTDPEIVVDLGCFEEQQPSIPGDANLDCKVNILDLIFIRNRLNQSIETGDNWQANVNGDDKINILDLIFTRNHLNTQCPDYGP